MLPTSLKNLIGSFAIILYMLIAGIAFSIAMLVIFYGFDFIF